MARSNHLPCPHHDGANGHLTRIRSGLRLAQSQLHEADIFRRMGHG
jgi:hypothetical protein